MPLYDWGKVQGSLTTHVGEEQERADAVIHLLNI